MDILEMEAEPERAAEQEELLDERARNMRRG
jgi:hypothetical protein